MLAREVPESEESEDDGVPIGDDLDNGVSYSD